MMPPFVWKTNSTRVPFQSHGVRAITTITRLRQGFPGGTSWSLAMRKLLTFLIAVASLTITTLAFAQSPQVRLLLLGGG